MLSRVFRVNEHLLDA